MNLVTPRTALNRFAPVAYSVLLIAAAVISRFAVLSNDAFPLRWQSAHLSLGDPASFYNGFFPIGYPILLRITSLTQEPFAVMEVMQALAAALFAFLALKFFEGYLDKLSILLALGLTLLYPSVVRTVLSTTPDFAVTLGAVLAFYAISRRSYGIAGLALGASSLFRTHMLALIVAVIIAHLAFERDGRLRNLMRFCLAALPFVLAQGLLQVWTGHGFFESSQALNVHRMMYGIDWSNPSADLDASVLTIITHDPVRFAGAYLANLWSLAFYLIPIAAVLVWQWRVTDRSVNLMVISFSALLYLLLVTVGFSPRAVVPVWPVVVLAAVVIMKYVVRLVSPSGIPAGQERWARMALAILAVIALVGIFRGARHASARVEEYRSIAHLLNVETLHDAATIYSDDFGLYFPDLHDAPPRTSGGWAEVGIPGYLRDRPHLVDSTSDSFRANLLRNNLHFAIFRIPLLNERAWRSVISDTAHFKLRWRTASHILYSVE